MPDDCAQQILCHDGRNLGYAEFGQRRGKPILYCHGFPGSRLEACLTQAAAARIGAWVIAVDRPGYGLSDFQPGRILSDWPSDLTALVDALGIDRFAILGVSGGGPYAAAGALKMPDRLTRAGIVCGLGPLDKPEITCKMGWPARLAIALSHRLPWLARLLYEGVAASLLRRHSEYALSLLISMVPEVDQAVLRRAEVREALLASIREAFRHSARGVAWDLMLYTRPWGIDLHQIAIEVELWHGELDTIVPPVLGRYQAAIIPHCRTHFLAEGHYSLPINHMNAILSTLIA